VVVGLATPCDDYDRCWRPVPVPDDFPFVSWWLAALWLALFVVCVLTFVRRLGRE
jgi:hypothetical protein